MVDFLGATSNDACGVRGLGRKLPNLAQLPQLSLSVWIVARLQKAREECRVIHSSITSHSIINVSWPKWLNVLRRETNRQPRCTKGKFVCQTSTEHSCMSRLDSTQVYRSRLASRDDIGEPSPRSDRVSAREPRPRSVVARHAARALWLYDGVLHDMTVYEVES